MAGRAAAATSARRCCYAVDEPALSQVKQEIETAVGARVDRITQPGREELIVTAAGRVAWFRW